MNPTDVVVLGALCLLLAWEVWTLSNSRPRDTISETVWRAVKSNPVVPFLAGLLMGHWFWLPARCWELLQ